MAYNKVVYDGNILIDLTDLDVTAGDVVSGVTFIMADGTKAVGTITIPTKTSDLQNDSGFITNTLPNDGHIYGTLTDDSTNSLLTISASNNCVVGYGGYTNENGDTNVYGNNVHIRSKSDIKMNTVNITSPTLSSSGLSAYSSRVAITKGGVFKLGKWRFVQLDLLVKSSMAANNYWNILTGFDVPVTSYSALGASVRGQNNGLLSAYINSSGNLIVETDDAALSVDWSIEITGWYIAS